MPINQSGEPIRVVCLFISRLSIGPVLKLGGRGGIAFSLKLSVV